jgi:serine/threonine protein kinase
MLSPGHRLGPYEIVAPLGAGGMGEVYRARDTRLERDVAIKVLPPRLSADPGGRARFEREARTISSLSHPHVCALFDVGREGETDYLVMELVEGESLADRLARGALPIAEVLRYGAEIGEALDAAHRLGIVHRDLKPANVMITKRGAKLLDFGLARIASGSGPVTELAQTVATAHPLTEPGTILGTFQYMSPEQLEGQEAGARTDIFAFGALLYEMSTGRRAFAGKSRSELIAAIVSSQPPTVVSQIETAPPALDHLIRRCLEKDPDARWQSARDVASQLRWIADAGSQAGVPPAIVSSRRIQRRSLVALAMVGWLIAAGLGVWAGMALLRSSHDAGRLARTYSWPMKDGSSISPSPDGKWLATIEDGYLSLRRIDEPDARRVEDSRGAGRVAWAPDSSVLAYISTRTADGKRLATPEVRRVGAGGLSSTMIARVAGLQGIAFGSPGVVYLASAQQSGARILSVPIGGGEPTPYLETRPGEPEIRGGAGFTFLPDGKTLLCVVQDRGRASLVVRTDTGFESLVVAPEGGSIGRPRYARQGYVLYTKADSPSAGSAIWALPFDASTRKATGAAVQVAASAAAASPTDDGALYFTRLLAQPGPEQLVWIERTGRILSPIGQPQRLVTSPALSPDGRLVAVRGDEDDDTQDVWLHDVERRIKTRLSSGVVYTWRPAWSPDGGRIAFQSRDPKNWGSSDLYVQDVDGRTPPKKLVATALDEFGPNWSPDGRFIVYTLTKEDTDRDIWVVGVEAGATPRPLLASRFAESMAFVSPDGTHMAYVSDRTGQSEVFVTTFPEPGREVQVSSGGGLNPQWAANEIVYTEPDTSSLVSVPISTSPALRVGSPVRLFSQDQVGVNIARSGTFDFAITPKGDRLIAVQDLSPEKGVRVAVVENWVDTLNRR